MWSDFKKEQKIYLLYLSGIHLVPDSRGISVKHNGEHFPTPRLKIFPHYPQSKSKHCVMVHGVLHELIPSTLLACLSPFHHLYLLCQRCTHQDIILQMLHHVPRMCSCFFLQCSKRFLRSFVIVTYHCIPKEKKMNFWHQRKYSTMGIYAFILSYTYLNPVRASMCFSRLNKQQQNLSDLILFIALRQNRNYYNNKLIEIHEHNNRL